MEQCFSSGGSNASGDSVGGFGQNTTLNNASGNDIIYNKNVTQNSGGNGNGLTPEVKEIYR